MDWEILDFLTTYQTQEGIDGIRDFFWHFPGLHGQAMLLTAPPDSIYLQLIFRMQFGLFYLYTLQKYITALDSNNTDVPVPHYHTTLQLLITSASTCLKNSRNLGPTF